LTVADKDNNQLKLAAEETVAAMAMGTAMMAMATVTAAMTTMRMAAAVQRDAAAHTARQHCTLP
jgi:hypothetical protein